MKLSERMMPPWFSRLILYTPIQIQYIINTLIEIIDRTLKRDRCNITVQFTMQMVSDLKCRYS